jgi:serine/threonine protein kinase
MDLANRMAGSNSILDPGQPDQYEPVTTRLIEEDLRSEQVEPDDYNISLNSAFANGKWLTSNRCEWCRRPFLSTSDLEEHTRATQARRNAGGTWMCYSRSFWRDRKTQREENIEENMSSLKVPKKKGRSLSPSNRTRDMVLKCPIRDCGMEYSSQSHLDYHHLLKHSGQQARSELERCSLDSFSRPSYLGASGVQEEGSEEEGNVDEGNEFDHTARIQEPSISERDSEDDDVGDLINPRNADTMASLYGTSMPKASFFSSFGSRGTPMSPLVSMKKGSLNLASPGTFQTAHSSLASYITAPSTSLSISQTNAARTFARPSRNYPIRSSNSTTAKNPQAAYSELVNGIVDRAIFRFAVSSSEGFFDHKELVKLREYVSKEILPVIHIGCETSRILQRKKRIGVLVHDLVGQLVQYEAAGVTLFELKGEDKIKELEDDITMSVLRFIGTNSPREHSFAAGEVFSSEWLMHLHNRGILLDPLEELDWSGEGQHVEYSPEDEGEIPLRSEKILGHSQTAIIDSVRCRRIRLARKKITCSRRLKKEDAIVEVEHLMRLQHAHIVRVVGTYTLKKDLAILLYPAAEWDLDSFLDDLLEVTNRRPMHMRPGPIAHVLIDFLGCLSNAIAFIHDGNVKHMDIKPKNLLVRIRKENRFKIYVADFGIARSYKSAADSETDSPTSFTRAYAAPEVVHQDKRGLSADIFSLGCVFMEMMATLFSCSTEGDDERERLLDLRKVKTGNPAFYANIDVVTQWYKNIINVDSTDKKDNQEAWMSVLAEISSEVTDLILRMIMENSDLRPSASELKEKTARISCAECSAGPEPFEAADLIMTDVGSLDRFLSKIIQPISKEAS